MSLSSISKDKIDAYRGTHYRFVSSGTPCVLLIGRASADLGRLFQVTGTGTALFITAFNPYGAERDLAANEQAHDQLLADLKRLTPHIFSGEGADPAGLWPPEKSLLALGLTEEAARALATTYAQDAVVWTTSDAVPRLLLLR